jgi:hypothetical protein
MPPAKLSEAVRAILDGTRQVEAELEFSKEDAELIFAGSKTVKVADMTETQLLQYCLLSAHSTIRTLTEALAETKTTPNRETRRALERKSR